MRFYFIAFFLFYGLLGDFVSIVAKKKATIPPKSGCLFFDNRGLYAHGYKDVTPLEFGVF